MSFRAQDVEERDNTYLRVIARMKPGATLESARAEMRLVAAQVERAKAHLSADAAGIAALMAERVTGRSLA